MTGPARNRLSLTALLGLVGKCLLPGCTAPPAPEGAGDAWFESVRWEHRLLVIDGSDEVAARQVEVCRADGPGLLERDLIVVALSGDDSRLVTGARADLPAAETFRTRFELDSDSFEVVLVGKDGGVKERRDRLFATEALFDIIDAMPMRMREMRERGTE